MDKTVARYFHPKVLMLLLHILFEADDRFWKIQKSVQIETRISDQTRS